MLGDKILAFILDEMSRIRIAITMITTFIISTSIVYFLSVTSESMHVLITVICFLVMLIVVHSATELVQKKISRKIGVNNETNV